MSARFPIEANEETPSPRSLARSISARPSAPLWVAKPTPPRGGVAGAKVTFSRACSAVLRIPRQFGPTRRIPAALQTSTSRSWSSAPSGPVSAKPAEITTSAGTRLSAHSRATSITAGAGTAIDGEVDLVGHLGDAGIGPHRLHHLGGGVHWIDDALESRLQRVVEELPADRAVLARGADHGDRPRFEERTDRCLRGDPVAVLEMRDGLVGERGRELHVDRRRAADDISTGKPLSRKTSIILWFSGITSAVKTEIPFSCATSARWASRSVPSPSPCRLLRDRERDLRLAQRGHRSSSPARPPRRSSLGPRPGHTAASSRRPPSDGPRGRGRCPPRRTGTCASRDQALEEGVHPLLVLGLTGRT